MASGTPTAVRKAATGHFITQRLSAVALLMLGPWFAVTAAISLHNSYDSALAFVASPVNAVLLGLLLLAGAYHFRLGLHVIIEDYIAKEGSQRALMILATLFSVVTAVAGLWAIAQIAFL